MIGVGILGAGPVTQAIHLPTLARMTDTFRVARVMDVSAEIAEKVAARVGAAWTTNIDELLGDPDVDVVAVCSPQPFHAQQVIAACNAGKKAVLCEKPFGSSAEEAFQMVAASEATGVPIIVGAMHAYDPGWLAVSKQLEPGQAHTIRSSIVLPPNPRFEDFATEVEGRPAATGGTPDLANPEFVAAMLTGGMLGLAIHDLPLIRQLVGDGWEDLEVLSAEFLPPWGYLLLARIGDLHLELHAVVGVSWSPDWRLAAIADDAAVEVQFTPSYVQAGSATGSVVTAGSRTLFDAADHNGYEGEWREIARVVGGAQPQIANSVLIDDLRFALDLATQAAAFATDSKKVSA